MRWTSKAFLIWVPSRSQPHQALDALTLGIQRKRVVWRKKVASGDVIVVRYADGLVVGFQH